MADNVTPQVRSRIMAQIKSKGMKPEMRVRRLLHGLGYRYRLHRDRLTWTTRLGIFYAMQSRLVNGCFWHFHSGCPNVRIPATNREYWVKKLECKQSQR